MRLCIFVLLNLGRMNDDGSTVIQIVDAGVGMNGNQMDEVLRLSGESDSTVARLGGGTGLVIAFGKKFD